MNDKVVFYTTSKTDLNNSRSNSPKKTQTPSNPLHVKSFNTTMSSHDMDTTYINQSRPQSANTRPLSARTSIFKDDFNSRPQSAKPVNTFGITTSRPASAKPLNA